jgi:hypothetical protein
MRRLLPLLCFALLPAAIAAPVPPGKRAEFGANGVITTEELEQVKFDTRPLKPEEREKVGDLPAMREQEDERKPTKPRAENRYDLAVHMPWKHFDEGESIPAYFVLRNNRGHILSLDARLSLFGSRPTIWNSCSIDVRNAKTGKAVHVISTKGWRIRSRLALRLASLPTGHVHSWQSRRQNPVCGEAIRLPLLQDYTGHARR